MLANSTAATALLNAATALPIEVFESWLAVQQVRPSRTESSNSSSGAAGAGKMGPNRAALTQGLTRSSCRYNMHLPPHSLHKTLHVALCALHAVRELCADCTV